MLKVLRQLRSSVLIQNPWWQYRLDAYEHPDGSEGEFHYVHTPGSVFVIAVTDDEKFVLTKQYRYLNRRTSIEFCGGGVKAHLGIEGSARAELQEETGFECGSLTQIGSFNPMNGVTDELCTVFVARDLKPVPPKPDTTEEFEICVCSRSECVELIRSGELWDGMTLAALALFDAHSNRILS